MAIRLGHKRKSATRWVVEDRGYNTPCWVWTQSRDRAGYGHVHEHGTNRTRRAHRVVYEQYVGPIPEGLVLDHLCRVKPCVNPEHLEPVTQKENVRRGKRGVLALVPEPQLVMATVSLPDGRVESEALFVEDDGLLMRIELPDGSTLSVDDREFDSARRAA